MNAISSVRTDPVLQVKEMHYNNFDVYHYLTSNEEHDKMFGF